MHCGSFALNSDAPCSPPLLSELQKYSVIQVVFCFGTTCSQFLLLLGFSYSGKTCSWSHHLRDGFIFTRLQLSLDYTNTHPSRTHTNVFKFLGLLNLKRHSSPYSIKNTSEVYTLQTSNLLTLIATCFLQALCLLIRNISLSASHLSQQHQK